MFLRSGSHSMRSLSALIRPATHRFYVPRASLSSPLRFASAIPTPTDESSTVVANLPPVVTTDSTSILSNALGSSDALSHPMPYIGELAAHGIGSWTTPVGLIENLTEFCTVSLGGSWIAGIVGVTLGFRVLLLPVVFNGMRNNYTMANLRPQIVEQQERIKEVEAMADEKATMAARMKLVEIFKKNDVNPLKAMLPLVTQMPIFISFFLALRKMASTPIESMVSGGALWFPNLTMPDPYYALPVLASAFLLATVELGSDGIQQQPFMKKFFRVMAVGMLPMTSGFPAGILVYWITSNAFSLGQLALSRAAFIKNYYKIPPLIQHNVEQKPFMEQLKEGYNV